MKSSCEKTCNCYYIGLIYCDISLADTLIERLKDKGTKIKGQSRLSIMISVLYCLFLFNAKF